MKEVDKGYIALFRQFIEWEWYDDANTMRLFIHCLLLANYKDKKWRGKTIKRGQFITSQPKLANSLKLSIMQIRNSLTKLKTTGEITVSTTADYSIITVKNYNLYQDNNRQDNSLTSENEQARNSLTTTTNNSNKGISNKSLSINNNENQKEEVTEEEREIITKHVIKKKLANKSVKAYVNKIIANGDYKDILEEYRNKKKKEEDRKNALREAYKKVTSKYLAAAFVGEFGDYTDENHPEEVKQIMEDFNIQSFTEAVTYTHEHKEERDIKK